MHADPTLLTAWILVVGTTAALVRPSPPEPRPPLRAAITVVGFDSMDSLVRESMLAEVSSIYRDGAILFDWGASHPGGSLVEVVIADRPANRVVVGCRRRLHDHRLGVASMGRRRITLWTHQIERAVTGDWDRRALPRIDTRPLGAALGRVLAHELGHMLLRLVGHQTNGLMRSSFSHRSLASRSNRSFRLSPADLDRIRRAIESRD